MNETSLQKNIKARLEKHNISIAELERRAGFRYAVINILHGRSKNPSIKVAQAIAKELGCTVEELLAEAVQPPPADSVQQAKQPDPLISNANIQMNGGVNKLISQQLPWQPELAGAALAAVNQYLFDNTVQPPISAVFACVEEIYRYAILAECNKIDPIFVNWIAEKLFILEAS